MCQGCEELPLPSAHCCRTRLCTQCIQNRRKSKHSRAHLVDDSNYSARQPFSFTSGSSPLKHLKLIPAKQDPWLHWITGNIKGGTLFLCPLHRVFIKDPGSSLINSQLLYRIRAFRATPWMSAAVAEAEAGPARPKRL